MWAHIEPIAGVARVFEAGKVWGDSFVWSCALRWRNFTEVEVLGVTKAPTVSQMRALVDALRAAGVETIILKRHGEERRKHVRRLGDLGGVVAVSLQELEGGKE